MRPGPHLKGILAAGDGGSEAMHIALQRDVEAAERAQALRLAAALPQAFNDGRIQLRIWTVPRLHHLVQHLGRVAWPEKGC